MTVSADERGQILILLAMWLFFGGSGASALIIYDHSVSHMKQGVKEVIADAGRKQAILSDINQWEHVYEGQNEKVSEARKELLEAMRHKDTQRSQLEPIMAKLDQSFLVMNWDFLNLRFRVKEKVTAVEWAQIVPRSGDGKAHATPSLGPSELAAREAWCVRAAGCAWGVWP